MPAHESPEMLVKDLMTTDVFTVDRNEALLTADRMMNLGRIRHVVVVGDDGELAGVVSQRDLFHSGLIKALGYGTRAMQKTLDTLMVKEVMSTDVVTTRPDTPLRNAAELMFTRKIGCLPVVDGSKLVGILTEADFVKLHSR
jgi:CBS domain-containing membrane protein